MTPLAEKIWLDIKRPKTMRKTIDYDGCLNVFSDFHCFELSSVQPEILSIANSLSVKPDFSSTFLPAERTWMEFKTDGTFGFPTKSRIGIMCQRIDDHKAVGTTIAWWLKNGQIRLFNGVLFSTCEDDFEFVSGKILKPGVYYPLNSAAADELGLDVEGSFWRQMLNDVVGIVRGACNLINAPRGVGRKNHLPSAGLQQSLAKRARLVGKFPLQAWTEIFLNVGAVNPNATPQQIRDSHLSNGKTYHFVRCFERALPGRKVRVKEHWRGNPALGIKQSRYVLTP